MEQQNEVPLTGGNVNSQVVRIGNTVRRTMSAASPTVHQLLRHLEKRGFTNCPRFLGIDNQNREIISFIAGETGIPESIWQSDEPLIGAATMLRQYHEATMDFTIPADAIWGYSHPDPLRHEVICHNDFAPYNFIYREGNPIAIIDFDLAGPGPRLRDVAYATYWMTPLSFNSSDQSAYAEADLQDGSRRLQLLCETYGVAANAELLAMVAEVLTHMGSEEAMRETVGDRATAQLKSAGHLDHWQRESAAFQENRSRFRL